MCIRDRQYKKAFLKGNTAMDFKDEIDFITEKAKQLTDTGIRKADAVSYTHL